MPIGYFDKMDQERRMAGWMIGMRRQVNRLVRKDVRVLSPSCSVTWGYPPVPRRRRRVSILGSRGSCWLPSPRKGAVRKAHRCARSNLLVTPLSLRLGAHPLFRPTPATGSNP